MKYVFGLLMCASLGMLALTGCESQTTETNIPLSGDHGDHEHGDHDHGDGSHDHGDEAHEDEAHGDDSHAGGDGDHGSTESAMTEMERVKAELAKLSPEDAASAAEQQLCPVSGELLGTMGAPLKIDVNSQDVWICCKGCEKDLLAKPDEYLAKLSK